MTLSPVPVWKTDWVGIARDLGPSFAARAALQDADDSIVANNFDDLKVASMFSAAVPAELGGGGATHSEMCAVLRELAHHCSSTALAFSMHQRLIAAQVWNYRHNKPGRKILERVAAEQLVLVSTGGRDWLESKLRGEYHPLWNVVLTVALPLLSAVYVGIAEQAFEIAKRFGAKRADDPTTPYLLGETQNALTTAQLALDDMVRLANDLDVEPDLKIANSMLVRKTIAVGAALETTQKAMEATGGAGYFRAVGLERLVHDANAGSFHPLPEKKQQLFTGRLAMGLDPVA